MGVLRVAAVQAAPVLMDRAATIERVSELTRAAAADGARLVAFPESFVPGPRVWNGTPAIGDDDAWQALLLDQAVTVPSAATRRLGAIASTAGVSLVIGVTECDRGAIHDTLLHFAPDGKLVGKERKLTSAEGVWGMYAQGVDVWVAPALATGDAWVATLQRLAREGRMFVIGVNPCIHAIRVPATLPGVDALHRAADQRKERGWLEPGNTVIIDPAGDVIAGPARHGERIVVADLHTSVVGTQRWAA